MSVSTSPLAKHVLSILPPVLVTLGSVLIANVIWPILSYQLFISPELQRQELVLPISLENTVFANPVQVQEGGPKPALSQAMGQELDYTKASNWFPEHAYQAEQHPEARVDEYYISIPTVNIEKALVKIGGEDLSKSLIQYPGTSKPGQLGSPVIFGHSVLRQFYNPSINNPRRYASIFSKIMTLKSGEEIVIEMDGITYKYTVKEIFEVKPEDVYILQQRYNNRELKLVTCVPEGTYLRRGVVVAQLQDISVPNDVKSD